MAAYEKLGADAIEAKGWIRAHKWLLLRRISQFSILGLFLLGPIAGIWIIKGNLASSLILDTVPLGEPLLLVQMFAAGFIPVNTAIFGTLIVVAFYMLVGGRVYCSWVCPINIVTDAAHWLRHKLGIKGSTRFSRKLRYWMLAMVIVLSAVTGTMAYELFNPVSLLHRGIIFGLGFGWSVVIAVFLFDLFVSNRGWCSHLCPMGGLYSLIGRGSLVRVRADKRSDCNDCMECFAVCPEQQVLKLPLKGASKNVGPVVLEGECTNCGRCIDICSKDVFSFGLRINNVEKIERVNGASQHA